MSKLKNSLFSCFGKNQFLINNAANGFCLRCQLSLGIGRKFKNLVGIYNLALWWEWESVINGHGIQWSQFRERRNGAVPPTWIRFWALLRGEVFCKKYSHCKRALSKIGLLAGDERALKAISMNFGTHLGEIALTAYIVMPGPPESSCFGRSIRRLPI